MLDLARLHDTPDPALVSASRRIIESHQHRSGAYPASPTFSAYQGYSWFRDGAFIAEGMRRGGAPESAAAFHGWCAGVLLDRSDQIAALVRRAHSGEVVPATEMLPTRFTLDGREGTDPWWDFQLDGYGTWLWALAAHTSSCGVPSERTIGAAALATGYLTAFWERPCYDWWEEHEQHRHVSTLGAIRGGLQAVLDNGELRAGLGAREQDAAASAVDDIDELVVSQGVVDGHLVKWLGSESVDASLVSCTVPFELSVPNPVRERTLAAVEEQLSVEGGVHRYLDDTFYGGGQWLLLSAFVGWNHAVAGNRDEALRYLRWIETQADGDGAMPEQVGHHLLAPDRKDEWVSRWGKVAQPLLWSHGMHLVLASELTEREEPRSRATVGEEHA